MNAVVSGQAGVALLLEGEELFSLHADRPGEVIRRHPREVPFLLGEAKDLQLLNGLDVQEVSCRLEQASDQVDALHLALILLDESLSADTRRTAAEELEELLGSEENHRFVEKILHARPFSNVADLVGACAVCPGIANLTRSLLGRLAVRQEKITEVYFAWEQIPEDLFEKKQDRAHAQSIAVREGFFRDLVLLRAAQGSIDSFLMTALCNESFRGIRNQGDILRAWLLPLRLDQRVRPERVEVDLQAAAVAENTEEVHRTWLAGLGALAAAKEEGSKVFDRLVERGRDVESKGKAGADTVKTKAENTVESWSEKFDEKLTAALHRLGVPTRDEIHALMQRVEELNAKAEQLKSRMTSGIGKETVTPKAAKAKAKPKAKPKDSLTVARGSRK